MEKEQESPGFSLPTRKQKIPRRTYFTAKDKKKKRYCRRCEGLLTPAFYFYHEKCRPYTSVSDEYDTYIYDYQNGPNYIEVDRVREE